MPIPTTTTEFDQQKLIKATKKIKGYMGPKETMKMIDDHGGCNKQWR